MIRKRHKRVVASCLVTVGIFATTTPGFTADAQFELVTDLAPGSTQSDLFEEYSVGSGVLINGYTLFQGCTEAFGCEVWRSDGTALGTEMLVDIDPGPRRGLDFGSFALLDGYAYFTGGFPTQLWRTDGTPEGTEVFVERVAFFTTVVTVANGALWFEGWDEEHGEEPWTSDGTVAGTRRIADLEPGSGNSNPINFAAAGALVYFSADTTAAGRELYATDGTEAGTYLVADIQAGSGSSGPSRLHALGSQLLFSASDGTTGSELWRTDGTGVGTVRLEIRPGPDGSDPRPFGEVPGGVLLLSADDGISGRELWRTNGTLVQQVVDLSPGPGQGVTSTTDNSTVFGDFVYFEAFAGTDTELWRSDGTAGGTTLVADINPLGPSFPKNLVPVGAWLFFSASTPDTGRELWVTNLAGTVTQQVVDLDGGAASSLSNQVTGFAGPGDTFLFPGEVDPFGLELWRTDGTAGGTQRLTDVVDPASSEPRYLVPWQGGLAFQAGAGDDIGSLVTTDGTSNGTDLHDFPFPALASAIVELQGDLYLTERSSADSLTRLWKWNGFAETLIAEDDVATTIGLTPTQPGVAFSKSGELSITDGAVVGDFSLLELASPPASSPSRLWYGSDAVWYTVGEELWRTDLANDTSELLVDVSGDPELSFHQVLGESVGAFYFSLRRTVGGFLDETLICATDDNPQGYSIVLSFDGAIGSVSNDLFEVDGQALLLSQIDNQAWQLNTLAGPTIPAGWVADGSGRPLDKLAGSSWLVFSTVDGLWRTDGTTGGTALLAGTQDLKLRAALDQWFVVDGSFAGRGLEFALVAPATGTVVPLPEIQPGPTGTVLGPVVVAGDVLWTAAFRLDVGEELFRLDLSPFLVEPASIVFTDDFESGDTLRWSATTP